MPPSPFVPRLCTRVFYVYVCVCMELCLVFVATCGSSSLTRDRTLGFCLGMAVS